MHKQNSVAEQKKKSDDENKQEKEEAKENLKWTLRKEIQKKAANRNKQNATEDVRIVSKHIRGKGKLCKDLCFPH